MFHIPLSCDILGDLRNEYIYMYVSSQNRYKSGRKSRYLHNTQCDIHGAKVNAYIIKKSVN
jgi:hypothetical protein